MLFLLLLPLPVFAAPSADVCEWAAAQASRESGVPVDILAALSLTETRRRVDGAVRPWAWSANSEGAGQWFDDPESAIAFAEGRVRDGRYNLDIGCFQLNYRWHGENFSSVRQMFDPLENARYAARFVSQLYAESGDWRTAAGAFHSRTASNANRYLARFDTLHAMLKDRGPLNLTDSPGTYNSFAAVQPSRKRAREKLMLLGAPLGSVNEGGRGSLAVVGGARGGLMGARGPMVVATARPLGIAGVSGPEEVQLAE